MKKALFLSASVLSLSIAAGAASAGGPAMPGLTNLDFANVANPGNIKGSFTSVDPFGWTGGSGLIFIVQNSAGKNPADPHYLTTYGNPTGAIVPAGGNYVMADGNPRFESGFNFTDKALVPGTTYTLSFYQGAGQQTGFTGATTNQWIVSLTDGAGLYVANKSNPTVPDNSCGTNCGYFSTDPSAEIDATKLMHNPSQGTVGFFFTTLQFTANAKTELLSFLAWGNNGNTTNLPPMAFLAGVNSHGGLGVPEPASWVMMGLGFAGLGAVARRRRAKMPALAEA